MSHKIWVILNKGNEKSQDYLYHTKKVENTLISISCSYVCVYRAAEIAKPQFWDFSGALSG
jgi:hypothetical protein